MRSGSAARVRLRARRPPWSFRICKKERPKRPAGFGEKIAKYLMKLSYTPEAPSGTADLRRPRGVRRHPQSLSGWSFFGWPRCGTQPRKLKKSTPKLCKIEVWSSLVGSLGPSSLQVALGSCRGQFWPALEGRRWSQDGPKRRQDAPRGRLIGEILRPRGAKKHPRAASWRHVASFLADDGKRSMALAIGA